MALVNDFMVGADPELVLLQPPNLARVSHASNPFFGFDHSNWVLEPHPEPNRSVRDVCKNLRKSLDYMDYQFGRNYRFRSGAYIEAPERTLTLGGHVHLDIPTLSPEQIRAMDRVKEGLEGLDILPRTECAQRSRGGQYGYCGDVRFERGRVEYRSLCSWLFDRKTAMLSMSAIKLAAVAPDQVPRFESYKDLGNFIELFKGKDDDADWMLDRGYFSKDLTARPDRSVTEAWRTNVHRGKEASEEYARVQAEQAAARLRERAERQAQRVWLPSPPTTGILASGPQWFVDAMRSENREVLLRAADRAANMRNRYTGPDLQERWRIRRTALLERYDLASRTEIL